ncbi:DUF418 domain-containing protein [uncultured Marivirga sp.]|uniref:DUF418 domain-containing protein n=1 Tax=uncultured Marivirga sp. TaxID=1123707 RepID=UPI0030EEE8ED|tara:strand:+ start:19096 stop:20355 length:1260 start_codon:yes stop_codon:yes gene_type:complete
MKNVSQPTTLTQPLKRITVLDALRGFALLGVILMHMLQNFGIFEVSVEQAQTRFPEIDKTIQWIGSNLIMGRFINIFAFLFGLSFFIQMDRAAKKGIDFRKRFIWRMFILLLIGVVGHSFYSIEIISIYAVFGLLLIPLYSLRNWSLLLLASLLLIGTPRAIQSSIHNSNLKAQTAEKQTESGSPEAREIPAHIQNPSFINSVKHNYAERFEGKLNYQFGMYGRGYLTFALFILGLVVGRIRFFETLGERKRRNLFLFVGFAVAALFVNWIESLFPAVEVRSLMRPGDEYIPAMMLVVKTLGDLNLVFFSAALGMGFIILYNTSSFSKYLDVLSPYGRMALTNYEMQGVIGAILFSAWAFGSVFSSWGATELFVFGIIIFVLQILLSRIWLKYFLYGPLEWLWRSGTYLKWQALKKRKS